MAKKGEKNEIKAGVVIIAAIAILAVFLLKINRIGEKMNPPRHYLAKFTDVTGLYPDSRVLYNGVLIGRVEMVAPTYEIVEGVRYPIIWVGLTVRVRQEAGINLRTNDTARVMTDITGVSTFLIQSHPGDAEIITPAAAPPWGKEFDADTVDAFVKEHDFLVGKTPASLAVLQEKVGEILDNVHGLVASVSGEEEKESINRIVHNVETASKDASEAFKTLNDVVQKNEPRLHSIIENADKAVTALAEMIDTNRQGLADAVADAKVVAGNFREASEGIKEAAKDLPETRRLVDERVKLLADRILAMLTGIETGARAALDNFALAGANFAETAERTRRAPWLLLHTPTKKEIDLANLYDSTRNLARTTHSLRVLTERLDALAELEPYDEEQFKAALAEIHERLDQLSAEVEESKQNVHEKALKSL